MTMIRTQDLTMQFGGLTAVKDFNLDLGKGKIIALIGPNGAGKTTIFNMITSVYKPSKGRIYFKEIDITESAPHLVTKMGIARTFQNIRLFKDLSVLDNVLIANHLHLKSNVFEAILRVSKYKKEERLMLEKASNLLDIVGLYDEKDEKSSSLPYGKQRKLEIARALATNPEVLLLDEPAAGMNPKETEEITAFIKQIRDDFKLTILLIEHHMQVVMDISEEIYVLDYGITIAKGSPFEIQNNERVIQAYLGVDEGA